MRKSGGGRLMTWPTCSFSGFNARDWPPERVEVHAVFAGDGGGRFAGGDGVGARSGRRRTRGDAVCGMHRCGGQVAAQSCWAPAADWSSPPPSGWHNTRAICPPPPATAGFCRRAAGAAAAWRARWAWQHVGGELLLAVVDAPIDDLGVGCLRVESQVLLVMINRGGGIGLLLRRTAWRADNAPPPNVDWPRATPRTPRPRPDNPSR